LKPTSLKVVLITKGTAGDLVPFLALGKALVTRGRKVTLVSHCFYKETAEQLGLQFVSLDTPKEFDAFVADGPLLETPQGLMHFFERHIRPTFSREYAIVRECCDTSNSVLIMRNMSSLAAQFMAEEDIPLISLFTTVGQACLMPLQQSLCEHLLGTEINALRKQLQSEPIADWHAFLHTPSAFLGAWPDWFARPEPSWPERLYPVGFLREDGIESGQLPEEVAEMFERDAPPILITGGTSISNLALKFYSVAAEACSMLGFPAILVTRHTQLVPPTMPAGVKWFRSLPFASLIPRVSAVVHHGGMSVIACAMASLVPQLTLPYGADRPDTSARLQRLGVAKMLLPGRWTSETVAEALNQLLMSPEVRHNCRDMASRLKGKPPAEHACEVVEQVILDRYLLT
jgi:rhamnosyltransferase subunit B